MDAGSKPEVTGDGGKSSFGGAGGGGGQRLIRVAPREKGRRGMDNSWQSLAVKRREGLRLPMQETWSGKISHAERQLSPWATATEHSRQHVFLLMGITQWGPAGSTVLEWTRRAEVFAGGRKAPYIPERRQRP